MIKNCLNAYACIIELRQLEIETWRRLFSYFKCDMLTWFLSIRVEFRRWDIEFIKKSRIQEKGIGFINKSRIQERGMFKNEGL